MHGRSVPRGRCVRCFYACYICELVAKVVDTPSWCLHTCDHSSDCIWAAAKVMLKDISCPQCVWFPVVSAEDIFWSHQSGIPGIRMDNTMCDNTFFWIWVCFDVPCIHVVIHICVSWKFSDLIAFAEASNIHRLIGCLILQICHLMRDHISSEGVQMYSLPEGYWSGLLWHVFKRYMIMF